MSEYEMKETRTSGRPVRCRGRGKRLAAVGLGLAVLAVLSVGALRAFGQGPRWMIHGHGACSPEDAQKHVTRVVGWVVDDVKGTPEQEKRLTEIAQAALTDLAPLHAELKDNRAQAAKILTQETVDRAALEALRAKQVVLMTTASTRLTKAIADAADVLTPSQRVQLAEQLHKHWS